MRPRSLFVFAMTVVSLSFISCRKYTCECTAYSTVNPEVGGKTNYPVKKKDKARICTDKSTQPDAYGNYTTCVIK